MSIAILFASIAFVAWGIGDLVGVVATRRAGAIPTSFWLAVISLVIAIILAPFQMDSYVWWGVPYLLLGVGLGVLIYLGVIFFYLGFREEDASVVGVISAAFPLIVVPLSVVFLGETLSSAQLFFVGITILAVVLSGLKNMPWRNKGPITSRGVLFSLATLVLWGVYFTFLKVLIDAVGWFWPSIVISATGVILLGIVMKFRSESFAIPRDKRLALPLIASAIILNIGGFSQNFALQSGNASLVVPISGAYPVLLVVGAYFIFKERLRKHQIFGVVLALAGIIGLSVVS